MGLVTISFPRRAPRRTTSTTSIKSCLVLKLPMNLVWSGVLNKETREVRCGKTDTWDVSHAGSQSCGMSVTRENSHMGSQSRGKPVTWEASHVGSQSRGRQSHEKTVMWGVSHVGSQARGMSVT